MRDQPRFTFKANYSKSEQAMLEVSGSTRPAFSAHQTGLFHMTYKAWNTMGCRMWHWNSTPMSQERWGLDTPLTLFSTTE